MKIGESGEVENEAVGFRGTCALLLCLFWVGLATPVKATAAVTIALPMRINSAAVFIADSRGLFKKAGVDLVSQPFMLGRDALQSLLDG